MGDKNADNVAWSYEDPPEPVMAIKGLIAFYGNRVDSIDVQPLESD
ncbi:MAG: DUF427 domain-containing protein [Chromatiales bacterium]|nr:DUF427 domain-containing protein [Chromatiales bacterium]